MSWQRKYFEKEVEGMGRGKGEGRGKGREGGGQVACEGNYKLHSFHKPLHNVRCSSHHNYSLSGECALIGKALGVIATTNTCRLIYLRNCIADNDNPIVHVAMKCLVLWTQGTQGGVE